MFKKLITGFMAAAFLAGCMTPRGEATRLAVDEALDEARRPPSAPADVEAALLPEFSVEMPDAAASEERFDVNTDSTPARAFFMALVEGTPYNMVVHPQVTGTISLAMKGVTQRKPSPRAVLLHRRGGRPNGGVCQEPSLRTTRPLEGGAC